MRRTSIIELGLVVRHDCKCPHNRSNSKRPKHQYVFHRRNTDRTNRPKMDVGDTPHQCNDMSNTWDFCHCDSDLGTELTNQAERMTDDSKTNEPANNVCRPCGTLEPST